MDTGAAIKSWELEMPNCVNLATAKHNKAQSSGGNDAGRLIPPTSSVRQRQLQARNAGRLQPLLDRLALLQARVNMVLWARRIPYQPRHTERDSAGEAYLEPPAAQAAGPDRTRPRLARSPD